METKNQDPNNIENEEKKNDNNQQNTSNPAMSNIGKFFDGVGKKAENIAKSTMDKSKELIEVAKLNSTLARENEKLKSAYTELGVIFYETIKDSENSYKEICDTIETCLKNIAETEVKINAAKGYNTCPDCRQPVDKANKFCANCGKKLQ